MGHRQTLQIENTVSSDLRQFGFAPNGALNREAGCTRRLRGAGLPLVLLLPNGHGSPSDVCYASGTEAIYRVL